jgi:hypothetical protein
MGDDDLKRAKEQGQAQYESIREMIVRLNSGEEEAREEIHQDALSIQVRSGWHSPGDDAVKPEEFEILLCTGGPAVRLTGNLDDHAQPESVTMEVQDWFQPWTAFNPSRDDDEDDVLLAYARCFYFGE